MGSGKIICISAYFHGKRYLFSHKRSGKVRENRNKILYEPCTGREEDKVLISGFWKPQLSWVHMKIETFHSSNYTGGLNICAKIMGPRPLSFK